MIRTTRLLLRRFAPGDVDDALAYRDDADFARFLSHVPTPYTRANAHAFVLLAMAQSWDHQPTFAIVFEERVIGMVSFEIHVDAAMVGYELGRAWWGQGIAVEAASAAIAWAIDRFGLQRIWAECDPRHERSIRVMEKLGMKREGVIDGDVHYALEVVR